jgi:hypothetical protein
MKTVTIHQPEYLPWIGFFDRIYQTDIFVILDDVQYQKNGFINRNKVKNYNGWQWITVPVEGKSTRKNINEVIISNQEEWGEKQWKCLLYNYSRAPYFKKYADFFEEVFKKKWNLIVDLDINLIENVMKMLGLEKKIEKSSLLNVSGMATERLVNICKKLEADIYLSGPGGKKYMDLERFKEKNVKVIFREFFHPVYPQQFGKIGFMPCLSIIDLLFNCGPESLKFISGQRK